MTKLLLSALALAGAAFLLGHFWPQSGPAQNHPDADGPAQAAPVVPELPISVAQAVAALPNTLDKRLKTYALIAAAKTGAEFTQLLQDFDGDESAEASIASRWAATDPQGCLDWLRFPPARGGYFPHHIAAALFRTWAAQDPAAALQAALQSELIPNLSVASLTVVEAVLQTDLQAGGKLLAERGKFPEILAFPENLWKVDPSGFVKALLIPGVVPDRNLALALAEPLKAWSKKDPAAVLTWLKSLSQEVAGPVLPHAIVGLAAHDPKAAGEFIATLPQASVREAAAASLALAWVEKDAASAFTYAVTAGVEKPASTLRRMSQALVEQGDGVILQAFNQLPAGKVQKAVLPALANVWLDANPTTASQFLNTLPASSDRNDAMKFIAKTWAENEPVGALKFLQQNPTPDLGDVFQRIVARHAGFDPTSAVRWSAQQPAERALAGVRASFNMMSTEYQMEYAQELIPTLPNPQLQAEAVRSFMEPFGTGQRLFDEGIKWAAALPPDLRAIARETILRSPLITPGERGRAQEKLQ